MRKGGIFVDSDVVISSLISTKGAAHLLLNEQKSNFVISNVSHKELEKVAVRLGINMDDLQALVTKKLKITKLTTDLEKIKSDFQEYTTDPNDTHIVAGAKKAETNFLLTYNVRHFNRQKIREDLNIVVLTPAQYLQYVRSKE